MVTGEMEVAGHLFGALTAALALISSSLGGR